MLNILLTAYRKDPALKRGLAFLEVIFYPGVWAVGLYRIAHSLYALHIPVIPRFISYFGQFLTGVEIHPGAKIGKNFFIDHAVGVVIGETTEIGNNVMLYHGVTLGGAGWWRDDKGAKRHPTVEDNVTIGVGATVLGPVVIKKNSKIGAMSLITNDVPENSTVVCPRGLLVTKDGATTRTVDPCRYCQAEIDWMI